ncbi:hypothetical protein DEA8626_01477 [Defluviimonas aquaemixtae]|uniref:DUF4157 domain-containing protein n=1 Tax=Albidovulum aquaemixtae TaxID=1542388 RepID=A0A2R8B5M5_9RHOB|nr:hypothetical protein [Defluviimonas aquaemixtae]SPH17948.1 hypothetical protein DEA8626_01477 [Defluviimonas aquaemixtae]
MRPWPLLCALVLLPPAIPEPAAAQGIGLPGLPIGMVPVRRDLWVDSAASQNDLAAIRRRIAAAEQAVGLTFGRLGAAPVWQVCVTPTCDKRNGMTTRAMTLGGLVITVSSRAVADAKTYVHERVHAELHRAEGFAGRRKNALPNWFDEGMATVISGSVGYPARRSECRAYANWKLPPTRAAFTALSKQNGQGAGPVYKASACAVLAWLAQGRTPVDAVRLLRRGRSLP